MAIKIVSPVSCLNYYIYTEKCIDRIKIYDTKAKVVLKSVRWFNHYPSSNNTVKEFTLPISEILKRNKVKLDGKTFIIKSTDAYDKSRIDLYIPSVIVNYKDGEITLEGIFSEPTQNELGDIYYKPTNKIETFNI